MLVTEKNEQSSTNDIVINGPLSRQIMKQKIHYIYLLLQSMNEQATTSLKAVPKIEPGVTPPVKPAEATTNNGSIAAASSTPDVKPTG